MMSLYALTLSGVQRLKRQMFGAKIQMPDGTSKDTAVQPFVDELIAALSDQNPINLPSPLTLNAPGGTGPSIIINRFNVDNINNDNSGNQVQSISGGVIRFIDQNGNIIDMPGPNGSPINIINSDGSSGTTGFSGTVTVVTAVTGSGSVSVSSCTGTVTITLNVTTLNMTFKAGLLVGVG